MKWLLFPDPSRLYPDNGKDPVWVLLLLGALFWMGLYRWLF